MRLGATGRADNGRRYDAPTIRRGETVMARSSLFALALSLVAISAQAPDVKASGPPRAKAPAGAEVYFVAPKDGETVGQDVTVRFGLKGMGVAPAGTVKDGTGHHHLLIDSKVAPAGDAPIPNDDTHKHFGAGQTETVVHLAPGDHTLQLDLGDAAHMQFDPPLVSKTITIHVK
jgi:hypothetical protein